MAGEGSDDDCTALRHRFLHVYSIFSDIDRFGAEAEGHELSFAVHGDHDKQFRLLFHLHGGI